MKNHIFQENFPFENKAHIFPEACVRAEQNTTRVG